LHAQSVGSVTIRSVDPADDPIIDLAVLSHPYDRRIIIESLRQSFDFLKNGSFPIEQVLVGPKSNSDEDLLVGIPSFFPNASAKFRLGIRQKRSKCHVARPWVGENGKLGGSRSVFVV
jgi:hypothetical protein